jgi:predicted amidohydrolase YtcJ
VTAADLLLADVEVDGRRVDVHVRDGLVHAIGADLPRSGTTVVDGRGGALVPGLHDHHLHLNAMAAVRRSVDVSPEAAPDRDVLARALATAPGTGWVRAVGYHESTAGPLDRDALDELAGARPVRVQHRSGALWVLNTAALERVADHLDDSEDVERDATGRPTGRLWRYDARLVRALPDQGPEQRAALEQVARELLRLGITGVTDATPNLDARAARLLSATDPLRLHLLGAADLPDDELPPHASRGPRKVLLRDHDLPSYDDLLALLDPAGAGTGRRPVAVHCVSRESLVLTLAALAELGSVSGDRIEHAAVTPPELEPALRELGVAVVSQPDFLRTRGDAYLSDVDPDDRPWLYRWAGLARAGVSVCASSDAPYGSADPWQVVRSATERRTLAGSTIGVDERVDAATALASYLSPADDPGGPPRRVAVGAPADLCLLGVPRDEALHAPNRDLVALTLVGGVDPLDGGSIYHDNNGTDPTPLREPP